MRKEVYERSYSNESLTIPSNIWNDSNVKGIAKMMLAFYKKMSKDGATDIKNLTIRQSEILATREKDIRYNQQKLLAIGAIEIYKDIVTGEMIKYTYSKDTPKDEESDTVRLF